MTDFGFEPIHMCVSSNTRYSGYLNNFKQVLAYRRTAIINAAAGNIKLFEVLERAILFNRSSVQCAFCGDTYKPLRLITLQIIEILN